MPAHPPRPPSPSVSAEVKKDVKTVAWFVISVLAGFLPAFYRRRWIGRTGVNVSMGAFVGGLVEMIGFLIAAIVGYAYWLSYVAAEISKAYVSGALGDMNQVQFRGGVTTIALISYLFRPTTLVCFYFIVEGTARVTAAVVSGEPLGTFPLWVAGRIHRYYDHRQAEKWLGPPVVDIVDLRGGTDFDIRILTCRPKDWTPMLTIVYQEQMYEMCGHDMAAPPRRFVYFLRHKPEGKVIRGMRTYDPQEPVRSVEAAEAPAEEPAPHP